MFNRDRLYLKPLKLRRHDERPKTLLDWQKSDITFHHPDISSIARHVKSAKDRGRPIILMMGAHVIRKGLSPLLIDLMEKGFVTHIATNGASAVHDYEFSLVGATAESVPRYINEGQFGLWQETGGINEIINKAYQENYHTVNGMNQAHDGAAENRNPMGFGAAVGKAILEGEFPDKDVSLFAAAYRLGRPVTVHVGIGYDINHQHPNCNGAALGATSYHDFLVFASVIERLEGGVLFNFGSAVMAPEVFLKALAMARNVAHQQAREVGHFTTAVFDLVDIGEDIHTEQFKENPVYYFRPYKTMLVRTVASGGKSFYVRGNHAETLPALYREIIETG